MIDEVEYKNGKLTMFIQEVSRAATVALLPNAPRVAGAHCRYCRASSNCQTYRRRARQVAADEFGEVPPAEQIPNDQLNEVLKEAVLLENWIKSIRVRALNYLQAGGTLPDYVLGRGPRKRIFQNDAEVIEWCQRHKLPLDAYMPRELVTPKSLAHDPAQAQAVPACEARRRKARQPHRASGRVHEPQARHQAPQGRWRF